MTRLRSSSRAAVSLTSPMVARLERGRNGASSGFEVRMTSGAVHHGRATPLTGREEAQRRDVEVLIDQTWRHLAPVQPWLVQPQPPG
jgi:hypothetical protein